MKKKRRVEKIALAIIGILLVLLLFYLGQRVTKMPEDIEAEIISRLNLEGKEIEIKKLTSLEELKEKYPVIYGEAKPGYYEITYPGKLIIYDYEDNRIVKEFDVTNIKVG